MFVAPGDEENQADAGTDGGVGEVERGKANLAAAALLHKEINKINDLVPGRQQTVREIAGNAAEDETERNLAGQRVGIEMMPRKKERDEREQRDKREGSVVAAKQAPRGTGVAPVNELKKAIDDNFLITFFKEVQHEPFGELIQDEHHRRNDGEIAIGFFNDGTSLSHLDFAH